MSFTPGPWVAVQSNTRWHGTRPIFENGLFHILPKNNLERLPIASVDHADDHSKQTRERAECDARLIAAAPDLLAAAKLTVLNFERSDNSDNFLGDDDHEAWSALNTAIAKAEGHTNKEATT